MALGYDCGLRRFLCSRGAKQPQWAPRVLSAGIHLPYARKQGDIFRKIRLAIWDIRAPRCGSTPSEVFPLHCLQTAPGQMGRDNKLKLYARDFMTPQCDRYSEKSEILAGQKRYCLNLASLRFHSG